MNFFAGALSAQMSTALTVRLIRCRSCRAGAQILHALESVGMTEFESAPAAFPAQSDGRGRAENEKARHSGRAQ